MKRQGNTPKFKFAGEERVRSDSDSLLSKFLDFSKAAPKVIIDSDVSKTFKQEALGEAQEDFKTLVAQVRGVELSSGQELKLQNKKNTDEQLLQRIETPQPTQSHYEYVSELNGTESRKEVEGQMQIRQQIEMILVELKKVKSSSEELDAAFKDVVIDVVPEKPGIYHLRFFEGFLKIIIKLREKMDDASIFAKLFRSRKAEKSYMGMAKKRGTSFTLHHDRTPATQTG